MKRTNKNKRDRQRYKKAQLAQYFYFFMPSNVENKNKLGAFFEHPKITVAVVQDKNNDYGIGVAVCSPDDLDHMLVMGAHKENFNVVKTLTERGQEIAYGRALRALRTKKYSEKIVRFDVISTVIQCKAIDGVPFKKNILYKSSYTPQHLEPYILAHAGRLGIKSSPVMIDNKVIKSFSTEDYVPLPFRHGQYTSDIKNRPDGKPPRIDEDAGKDR